MKALVLFFFFISHVFASEKLDTLIVLYDAGETKGLSSLIQYFEKTKKNFKILTMGTSSELIDSAFEIELNKLLEKDIIIKQSWNRKNSLPEFVLNKIKNRFQPRIVLSGLVSKAQYQILETFDDSTKIGFYDSFSIPSPKATVNDYSKILDQLWIPSFKQYEYFNRLGFEKVNVVGHSSIKAWSSNLSENEKKSLRKELGLQGQKKIILYIGGYGDAYERGLEYFVKSLEEQKTYHLLLSLHPKMEGDEERALFKKIDHSQFKIAPKIFKTSVLAQISDFIITQNSTVGVQALLLNKKVIYYNTNESYKDIGILSGLSKQASNKESLNKILNDHEWGKVDLSLLGIPTNHLELFLKYLHSYL